MTRFPLHGAGYITPSRSSKFQEGNQPLQLAATYYQRAQLHPSIPNFQTPPRPSIVSPLHPPMGLRGSRPGPRLRATPGQPGWTRLPSSTPC